MLPARLLVGLLAVADLATAQTAGLQSRDLHRIQTVAEVRLSPSGTRVAYAVEGREGPGVPSRTAFILDIATGRAAPLGDGRWPAWSPRWAPDGLHIAYLTGSGDETKLLVARADGSRPTPLAKVSLTNHPIFSTGENLAWSPDGTRIAYLSTMPGPEPDANGDPRVITRYLYKPMHGGAFNDNRRQHVFVVDVATRQARPLTGGAFHDHSIAWSPRGDEIAFVSNREADPDRVFNNDLFAVRLADGRVRRLTQTANAEYAPAWSPDGTAIAYLGTRRPLTSSETTIEDAHVWLMGADGSNRRDVGAPIDNRQNQPAWMPDGRALLFAVEERGSVRLHRLPVGGGGPEGVLPPPDVPGNVRAWSLARNGAIACALATAQGPAELYLLTDKGLRPLTALNKDLLTSRVRADVEAFTFPSFDGTRIEAFLTQPLGRTAESRHPLIVSIHGGPHAQQGPSWNARAQVFAAQGWATLMVNYRGSTGHGQKLADAIFGDQDGGEARDVLWGVDAALAGYPWLDPERLGIEGASYGGQLTNWIVTQTPRFRAAVSIAGISNLVSFNYTAFYHDYLAVEFGSYPHEGGLMDRLWERSPLRHVSMVKTPVLLIHGEEDNDVPIAEAEQFFIALKDVGAETVMVRYPREGHGLSETAHVVDALDRAVAWYARHFAAAPGSERPE